MHVASCEDEVRNWRVLSKQDMTWPSFFKVNEALFLIDSRRMSREIVIQRSMYSGFSWTPESVLFHGRFRSAATCILQHEGHVDRAYETCPVKAHGFEGSQWHSLFIVGDLERDLLSPGSWRMSNHLPFPSVPSSLHQNRRVADYERKVMENCWNEGNVSVSAESLATFCVLAWMAIRLAA